MTEAERHEAVGRIFVAAQERRPESRIRYLEEVCGSDVELRRQVESLLKADENHMPLLDAPGEGGAVAHLLGTDEGAFLGTQVGRYRIRSLIAAGGMGIVYEAEQDSPRRAVAVKLMRRGMLSRSASRRFEFEAQLLARLHHPGIAQVYDAGVHDGMPYFVMELIAEARSLTQFAKALSVRDRMRLIALVCDAVQHGHQHGIIHRDLKPDNILIDQSGAPKIIDFGVARVTDSDVAVTTMNTDVGQVIGTIPYMSPEQIAGDPGQVDTRSDVFSLGVILYELLVGRLPHDVRDRSIAEAARIITDQEPFRLSSIDHALRGDIETIVGKALEKDRERRYQSAGEMAADIRRHLADQPIAARPASALYQVRKFARRNKGLVAGASAAVAALLIGSVLATTFGIRASQNAAEARRNRHDAERVAYRAGVGAAVTALAGDDHLSAQRYLEEAPPSLRGFEWEYASARLDASLTVRDLGKCATEIAVLPSGSIAAFADGRVVRDGSEAREQTPEIRAAGFSVDGRHEVRISGEPAVLTVIDHEAGVRRDEPLSQWGVPAAPTLALPTVSRSGRYVAFYEGWDGAPQGPVLWRVDLEKGAAQSRTPVVVFRGRIDVAEDGRVAYCGESGRRAYIWEPASDTVIALEGSATDVRSISFNWDGSALVTAGADGVLRLFRSHDGALLAESDRFAGTMLCASFRPDGELVAVGGQEGVVRLLDGRSLDEVLTLGGHRAAVTALTFTADGATLASASEDETIRTWCAVPADLTPVLEGHAAFIYGLAAAPGNTLIASAGWDGYLGGSYAVRLWDCDTGALVGAFASQTLADDIAFSPDGTRLATATRSGVLLADLGGATMRCIGPSERVASVDFAPDGSKVAALYPDAGHLIILDVSSGERRAFRDLPALNHSPGALAFSPDGRWIASSLGADRVGLCDAADLSIRHELADHVDPVWQVAFSPDSTRLITAAQDHVVRLWSVPDGVLLGTLAAATDDVLCAAFSPDGSRIATGGRNNVVRIWDARSFDLLASLPGHESYVKSLAFSPDGSLLISGSGDHTLRLWDTRPARAIFEARLERRRLERELGPTLGALIEDEGGAAGALRALSAGEASSSRRDEVLRQMALRAWLSSLEQ